MKKETDYRRIVQWLLQRGVRAELVKPRVLLPSYRKCMEIVGGIGDETR
ncbi:hypothetical protein [Parageobacillus thermoglucosidasius]|nr:hypothetical protein [Parageobacillus thermoglucosidasius]AEH46312.1 hypothetical protein Geoth_0264 [Parageobacillus thermoglucosidasius C56-YS93]